LLLVLPTPEGWKPQLKLVRSGNRTRTSCTHERTFNTLPVVNEVKDLGVFVDSNLTFHSHIDMIRFYSLELNSQMFCVARHLYLDESIHGLCSPHIGICFVRLVPISDRADQAIESAQRSFTRRLLYRTSIDYETRLIRLGVDSLELRRLRQDLIYTYKIVFGLVTNAGRSFSH